MIRVLFTVTALPVFLLLMLNNLPTQFGEPRTVPFPDDWTEMTAVSQGVNQKGGLLHGHIPDGPYTIFLNKPAKTHFDEHFGDFQAGKQVPPFPKDAKSVLVLYKNNERTQPTLVLGMHKSEEFAQTGGWGWQGWTLPDKKPVVQNHVTMCANCHYRGTKHMDGAYLWTLRQQEKK